jgi:hypothetical protein
MARLLAATAAGVYLSEGRHPILPLFHYSIIPVVSAANLRSKSPLMMDLLENGAEARPLFDENKGLQAMSK